MRTLLVLLTALLLSAAAAGQGQETGPDKLAAFADHLFDQGDYYRAITEYERLIFHYAGHPLARTARYKIALSYSRGNKFDQAVELFRALSEDGSGDEISRKSLFMLGDALFRKKSYFQAAASLEGFLTAYPTDALADDARTLLAWSHLRTGDWRQASIEFRKVSPDSPRGAVAAQLAERMTEYPLISKKSPALAGGLSAILPGAGQVYIERPKDAAVSFLLNGVFIWASVEAFRNKNEVTGGILLFFESGWYVGNIYNAVNGAQKYNRNAERTFLDTLSSRAGLSLKLDERGDPLLMATLRF